VYKTDVQISQIMDDDDGLGSESIFLPGSEFGLSAVVTGLNDDEFFPPPDEMNLF
jgi:hypothetical protein